MIVKTSPRGKWRSDKLEAGRFGRRERSPVSREVFTSASNTLCLPDAKNQPKKMSSHTISIHRNINI